MIFKPGYNFNLKFKLATPAGHFGSTINTKVFFFLLIFPESTLAKLFMNCSHRHHLNGAQFRGANQMAEATYPKLSLFINYALFPIHVSDVMV